MLPESSFIASIGLSFRDAPSAIRARAIAPLEESALHQLRQQGLQGVVEIHTCARSLWLISAEHPAWTGALLQALITRRLRPASGCVPELRTGRNALNFALRVSIGLDSYMQGEADIGRQVSQAFVQAHERGQADSVLHLLQQSVHRLLSKGRSLGFIRPNRGLGLLAVEALETARLPSTATVGVVGMGAIGKRVVASLRRAGRPFFCFNRTPAPDTLPLSDIPNRSLDALILCTAGPEGWFQPPAGPLLLDLGLPAQIAPGPARIGLDQLMQGDTLRMPETKVQLGEQMVEQELELLLMRLHAADWQRGLSKLNEVRDQFLEQALPDAMAESLSDLPDEQRRKVLLAARGMVRQYSHLLLTCLKDEFSTLEMT